VTRFLDELFVGQKILEVIPFRITRNADMSVKEDDACDLLQRMREVLEARKQSFCVRLEIRHDASRILLRFLKRCLKIDDTSVFRIPGPLNLKDFFVIAGLRGFQRLKNADWPSYPHPDFRSGETIFDSISRRDILLFHPYDAYDPVVRFVEEAADDPEVIGIKQILYRTSRESPIVSALVRAASNGKSVTAFIELKARFDEDRNIRRAQEMEQAGVQVIYGVQQLKTHAKLCIVVRRESDGVRRYIHFGTGNYNEQTARTYSDISYFTCDDEYGCDASLFFNTITGYSQPMEFRHLSVAPLSIKPKILSLIDGEIQRRKWGQKALIMVKVNALVDPDVIQKLYEASQQGVKIRLNVRGVCCLRPGIPGVSENIRVVSIVDRYLEHARIFYFHNGGNPEIFISSADWMPRNLLRRIELMIPIREENARSRLVSILETVFADNRSARLIRADGGYDPIRPEGRSREVRAQSVFQQKAAAMLDRKKDLRLKHFETHRPNR
jgi:polyphosphate kinase